MGSNLSNRDAALQETEPLGATFCSDDCGTPYLKGQSVSSNDAVAELIPGANNGPNSPAVSAGMTFEGAKFEFGNSISNIDTQGCSP